MPIFLAMFVQNAVFKYFCKKEKLLPGTVHNRQKADYTLIIVRLLINQSISSSLFFCYSSTKKATVRWVQVIMQWRIFRKNENVYKGQNKLGTNLMILWRRANARNVRLYYPYWQYTNHFIFRFTSLLCLCSTLLLLLFYRYTCSQNCRQKQPYNHFENPS